MAVHFLGAAVPIALVGKVPDAGGSIGRHGHETVVAQQGDGPNGVGVPIDDVGSGMFVRRTFFAGGGSLSQSNVFVLFAHHVPYSHGAVAAPGAAQVGVRVHA